jgi:hypothetical protein
LPASAYRFPRAAAGRAHRRKPRPRHLETLRRQIVGFINQVRALDLKKLPSVSETIDWARVLVLLQSSELDHETVKDTLNVLLKYEADIETTLPQVTSFVARPAGRRVRLMREELHRFFRAAREPAFGYRPRKASMR